MDDDSFSDDGIEDLPAATLIELEQNAYAATQRQREASEHLYHYQDDRQHQHWQGQSAGRRPPLQRHGTSTSHGSGSIASRRAAMSFGDVDFQNLGAGVLDDGAEPAPVDQQDVVLLDQTDPGVAENAAPPQPSVPTRWGDVHGDTSNNNVNNYGVIAEHATGDEESAQSVAETERLREQIEQLVRDRETMLQELSAAQSMVEARAGEIAIIRANQTKLQRSHESQLAALRSAMTEQVRKHQAEVGAAAMESKRVTTENAFLKQDLREEAFREREKASRLKEAVGGAKGRGAEEPVTPRKSRRLPFRDGFDDDEIMASPSKSAGHRSGRGTPSAPGKRKRQVADDSPRASVLQLSQSFERNNDERSDSVPAGDPIPIDEGEQGDETVQRDRRKAQREDRNVSFMRRILNHCTRPHKTRDLEVLSTMSFASKPDRTLASFILEATASTPSAHDAGYAVTYAKAVISLWSRCLKEKFFKPISLCMSIIKFILSLDTPLLAPPLIADLVPVLRETAYVNGLVRFRNSPNWHLNRGQVKQTPVQELHPEVNGTEALTILYTIATSGCMDIHSKTGAVAFVDFWTRMRFDFILMMLNPYQSVRDIVLILNLLSSSIQTQPSTATTTTTNNNNNDDKIANKNDSNYPTTNSRYTFGPIHSTGTDQTENEDYILGRAANLLSATPSVDEGQSPLTTREITSLRLEVMYFLTEVAFTPSSPGRTTLGGGVTLLASHPSVLARIFRSMHDELDALYVAHAEDERMMHAELVNGLTRLAYGVLHASSTGTASSPTAAGGAAAAAAAEETRNVNKRGPAQLNLHAVPGAVQKHLVVLTRLAFSERGVVGAGSSAAAESSMKNNDNDNNDAGGGNPDGLHNVEINESRGANVLLEAGIDLETVEMAHEMLEEAVNPQEAEALVEVFRPGLVAGGMEEQEVE